MAENNWTIISIIATALVGIYTFFLKHVTCHVNKTELNDFKKNVQFKDVCASERKRMEDCLESAMKLQTQRYESLEESIDEVKERLDKLINNRFEHRK